LHTQISPWREITFFPLFLINHSFLPKLFLRCPVTARCEVITRFLQRWRATKCLTHINLFQQPHALLSNPLGTLRRAAAAVAEFSLCSLSLSLAAWLVCVYYRYSSSALCAAHSIQRRRRDEERAKLYHNVRRKGPQLTNFPSL
jgi:hypothetical protein